MNSAHLPVHGIAQKTQQISHSQQISATFVHVVLSVPTFARRPSGRVCQFNSDTPLVSNSASRLHVVRIGLDRYRGMRVSKVGLTWLYFGTIGRSGRRHIDR